MILLWGDPSERPLARVADELDALAAPWQLLDQRNERHAVADVSFDGRLHATVSSGGRTIHLDAVTAAYHRCQDPRRLFPSAASDPAGAEWQHVVAFEDAILGWLEVTKALVVNRPSSMGANSSKPYQLAQIAACGFRVPDTLVTTDPDAAAAFWLRHGDVVYKSVSGIRSKVSRLHESDRDRLDDVRFCPTQFQQFVHGVDHRVHVVGDRVFATRVDCPADDYRYSGDLRPVLTAADIGSVLEERCVALSRRMGLYLAGIDLRRTPEGEWFCFEVNPSPAFTYYEDATAQPIAAAVAEVLMLRTIAFA